MYQYFVKIVPTIYESLDGNVINTNQFSVTEHTRQLAAGEKSGLPGIVHPWPFLSISCSPLSSLSSLLLSSDAPPPPFDSCL